MNKNYASDSSDLIRVSADETMVVYSSDCENVVIMFNNRKFSASLYYGSMSVTKKKDIIRKCAEVGLPGKLVYTEIEGSQEKYFCAERYMGNEAVCVRQCRKNGKVILIADVVVQKEADVEL